MITRGTPGRLPTNMAFVLLRYILIAATLYLVVVEGNFTMPPMRVMLLFAAALASNLALTILPGSDERRGWFKTGVILGDTVWITLALVWSGRFGSDFVYLYFFVLLLAAIGENLSLVAVGAVVICAGYGYVMSASGEQWSLWNSPSIIRLPFLFTASAFYGYLIDCIRKEQRHSLMTETTSAAKLELLATVSHEIRTPMTAILGYINLLGDPDATEQDRRECRTILRRNGEHLMHMLDDILDYARIEAGRLPVAMASVETRRLVSEIEATMAARAAEKGLALQVDFQDALPGTIRTDATRVRQILMNLVGNAIKFTAKGSVRLVVGPASDALDAQASTLRFDVVDTGPGITPADQAKLFRPFSQASMADSVRTGGTGLGLVISRRLAEMLGGELSMHSVPGVGSSFTLVLPAVLGEPEASEPAPAVPPPSPRRREQLGGRVLVAEDTKDNQRLITYYLKRAGLEVELVENGRAAVDSATRAVAEGKPFAVILMDMQMPVMDGYAATAALRRDGYRGAIVALTAYAMSTDRAKCLAAGCDGFLVKPIDPDRLIETLRGLMPGAADATEHADAAPEPAAAETLDMAQLVDGFLAGLEARELAIQGSLAARDVTALARHAHQLKGAAYSYGFRKLGDATAALDAALRAEPPVELESYTRHVIELCDGIRGCSRESNAS